MAKTSLHRLREGSFVLIVLALSNQSCGVRLWSTCTHVFEFVAIFGKGSVTIFGYKLHKNYSWIELIYYLLFINL